MNEHTPPPWEWVEDTFWGGYSGIVGPDNQEVLFPDHCNDGDSGAAWFDEYPSEADRRLIAAAPDGYVIAERLVKSVKYWAKHEKYAACPICEGYRISEAAYEHGDLCPAFLAEKYLALVDKETR